MPFSKNLILSRKKSNNKSKLTETKNKSSISKFRTWLGQIALNHLLIRKNNHIPLDILGKNNTKLINLFKKQNLPKPERTIIPKITNYQSKKNFHAQKIKPLTKDHSQT